MLTLCGCSSLIQKVGGYTFAVDTFTALIILIITTIFLIVIFLMKRQIDTLRIRTARELAWRAERERIAQDLQDDVGSGLTSIRLLAKSLLSKQDHATPESPLHSIGKISGELIDQMSEIVWLLNQKDNMLNQLLAHLRLYMAEYLQRTDNEIKLKFSNNITEEFTINGVQRRNILFVVKEVFHNVIKHSRATVFFMECSATNDKVIIMMKDNGIGLPENIHPNRNGLNIVKKRVAAIGGKISLDTNYGTLITIEIPKKIKT